MYVNDTIENRMVRDVISTMAIENMYLSSEFVKELLKVSNGEKTSEELRQEVLLKYERPYN